MTPTDTPVAPSPTVTASTIAPTATATPTAPPPTSTPDTSPTPTATSVTINYTYDPLYRLTAADYSTGEFFHYTYDAVGNRLSQDTLFGTNIYTYDITNRLTSVDGVPYTWDAKCNLLDDGVSTNTYDHASRLSSAVQGPDIYGFVYNGLRDRLQQTVNVLPTYYTLDLVADLTQVLQDGTSNYLYGVSRLG